MVSRSGASRVGGGEGRLASVWKLLFVALISEKKKAEKFLGRLKKGGYFNSLKLVVYVAGSKVSYFKPFFY